MKGYEKYSQKSVYILCRNREDLCSCFRIYFLLSKECAAAPRCISMFLKELATASETYQWTTAFERKCAADIFFMCVAASRNIWMFFNERAAASEKILMTASETY